MDSLFYCSSFVGFFQLNIIAKVDNFLHDPRTRHENNTKNLSLGLVLSGSGHNRVISIMTLV
jgi:hypothetical protein